VARVVKLGKVGGKVRKPDWVALGVVIAWTVGMIAYRYAYIEPRAWGAICAAAAGAPMACVPRAGLLWLQREYIWGGVALALGLWAFAFRGPFWVAVAAIMVGVGGVENYNATWAMIGLALGAWVWVEGVAGRDAGEEKVGGSEPLPPNPPSFI